MHMRLNVDEDIHLTLLKTALWNAPSAGEGHRTQAGLTDVGAMPSPPPVFTNMGGCIIKVTA